MNFYLSDPLLFFSKLKFVFQVESVLSLLGRGELPADYAGKVVPSQNENKVCVNCSPVSMTIILSVVSSSVINNQFSIISVGL